MYQHLQLKIEIMISIEAWRAVIGAFVGCKDLQNFTARCSLFALYIGSSFSMIFTSISLNLILILLMIGGIESNPGPNSEGNHAKSIAVQIVFGIISFII